MILTRDELRDLSGYSQRTRQKRWLAENGIPFLTGADGFPRVSRQTIEERLGVKAQRKQAEPNINALSNWKS